MPIKRATKIPQPRKGFVGKQSKMSFSAFLNHLLDINEVDPPDGVKLTDEDIIESVCSEFNKQSISVRKLGDTGSNSSLSAKRAKYNAEQPALLSIRYDSHQHPCHRYRKPVGIDYLREKAWRYGIIDPRLFTVPEIKKLLTILQEAPDTGLRMPTKELLAKFPFGSIEFAKGVVSQPTKAINYATMSLE